MGDSGNNGLCCRGSDTYISHATNDMKLCSTILKTLKRRKRRIIWEYIILYC